MDAGLPRCSAPQEGHLLSINTGPELVLPGPAMRPSCHMNYTVVTTCRGTVRPRTLSVLRALRPLPPLTRYPERMTTSHQRSGEHGPDILIVDT